MLTDTKRKELDAIGKMVQAVIAKFLSNNEKSDHASFLTEISQNVHLNQMYNTIDLDDFKRLILSLNIDEHLRLSLIHFFYKLHLTEIEVDKKQLAKEKCQLLINDAQTVNMEIFQIAQQLNN